jgi:hypothetical protein
MIHVITDASRQGEVVDDAHELLSALRLGWSVAEMRGRNRPGGHRPAR